MDLLILAPLLAGALATAQQEFKDPAVLEVRAPGGVAHDVDVRGACGEPGKAARHEVVLVADVRV